MKWVVVCVLVFLVALGHGKDDTVYELKGGDLFDLIRGRPPKDGTLKVVKADNKDGEKLPDGIFFIPEDTLEDVPSELEVQKKQHKAE